MKATRRTAHPILITAALSAAALLAGCAQQGVSPPNVTLGVQKAKTSSLSEILFNPDGLFQLFAQSVPSLTTDFGCFAVNVTGNSIAAGNSLSSSACTSTDNMQGNGFGTLSSPFVLNSTVGVSVPSGTPLNFSVYGLYPTPTVCGGTSAAITGYYLGSVVQTIQGSTSILIPISYAGAASDLSCGASSAQLFTPSGIFAAALNTCSVTSSQNVYCWGDYSNGVLGSGAAAANATSPVQVVSTSGSGALAGVGTVGGGDTHACAVNSGGGVSCWGTNANGELGNNTTTASNFPVTTKGVGGVGTLSSITAVAAGSHFSCAMDTGNFAYCWGTNASGQLGLANVTPSIVPLQVVSTTGTGTLNNVVAISASRQSACAVLSTGQVNCWGGNTRGELGDGNTTQWDSPINVAGVGGAGNLGSITSVTAAFDAFCAVSSPHNVYCWGAGTTGQLGSGGNSDSVFPIEVLGVGGVGFLSNIVSVSSNNQSSTVCALSSAGNVYCWGDNTYGQSGTNTTTPTSFNTPVEVLGGDQGGTYLSSVTSIAVGGQHVCALTSVGALYCWGANFAGQLSDGTTVNRSVPKLVNLSI